MPIEKYEEELKKIPTGIYFGFASVDGGPVYKTATSIGWNPFYKNTTKTLVFGGLSSKLFQEVHIIQKFHEDFYGKELKTVLLGYIRPESNFSSLGIIEYH